MEKQLYKVVKVVTGTDCAGEYTVLRFLTKRQANTLLVNLIIIDDQTSKLYNQNATIKYYVREDN